MLLGIESGWTIETWVILCLFVMFATLSMFGTIAAYRNGVVDGYGYSKEPTCPGYRNAGDILKSTMCHRWAELRESDGGK